MTHPFEFTLQCHVPADRQALVVLARRAEDLGYSMLTVPDHVDDDLGPIAALTAAADATETIGLGALVLCNDFRHPVVLAKEVATLDLLSSGRLTLGLGAGWKTTDYEGLGLPLDPPRVRIDRLAESVAVLKGLFADEPCTFVGEHYEVTALDGRPKPHQRPHPPFLIGGGGRRILELAAREADIVGLNIALPTGVIDASAGPSASARATDEKLAWIRAAAGDRFDELRFHARVHLAVVTDDRDGLAEAVAPGLGLTSDEAKESPHALAGTVDEMADQLESRRERWGISMIGVGSEVMDDLAPLVALLAAP